MDIPKKYLHNNKMLIFRNYEKSYSLIPFTLKKNNKIILFEIINLNSLEIFIQTKSNNFIPLVKDTHYKFNKKFNVLKSNKGTFAFLMTKIKLIQSLGKDENLIVHFRKSTLTQFIIKNSIHFSLKNKNIFSYSNKFRKMLVNFTWRQIQLCKANKPNLNILSTPNDPPLISINPYIHNFIIYKID